MNTKLLDGPMKGPTDRLDERWMDGWMVSRQFLWEQDKRKVGRK